MTGDGLMQIGEVAERTGLSLRTIRYYEEVGLVVPSARSQGGFRLYTRSDVDRLLVVKRMKPLEFTLEQMRELLETLDRLAADPEPGSAERAALRDVLRRYEAAALSRCDDLRTQLFTVQGFAADITRRLADLEHSSPVLSRRVPAS